jgi:hypothetical protein
MLFDCAVLLFDFQLDDLIFQFFQAPIADIGRDRFGFCYIHKQNTTHVLMFNPARA